VGPEGFEVTEIPGAVEDGAVGTFQVTMKVGFREDVPFDDD
jgi:flavin-binding protein dodecin